jgi:uncharacterized lipoprotein YajG
MVRESRRRRVHGWLVAVLVLVSGALFTGGCATSRGTLDIRVAASSNPAAGPAVKIMNVEDRREFQVNPRDPSIPSLKDDDIKNPAITIRAIARKRNTYGQALGDILLPEGRSVADLTREAVTRAFRQAGYRVLGNDDPAPAQPVTVRIDQFWAWMTPGFWALTLEYEARVNVQGPVAPFQEGKTFRGYASQKGQVAASDDWTEIVNKGLEDLTARIGAEVRP